MERLSTKRRWTGRIAAIAIAGVIAATAAPPPIEAARRSSKHSSDVAVAWFALLHESIKAEALPPTVASRLMGYAGVTLYESVIPGSKRHRSLAGQLNELDSLPRVRGNRQYEWDVVASTAMARVLRGLLPTATPATFARIDQLEADVRTGLKGYVNSNVYKRSAKHGRALADAILEWAADDGFASWNNCPYTSPVGPGLWEPTPPLFRPAHQPCWGQLRTFVLTSGGECAPPPHPAFSTDTTSDFYAEGLEVYQIGQSLSAEQMAIASFWSDDPGAPGTPPGHWLSIVNQLAVRDGWSLDRTAEAHARVGLAVADAFISCWQTKFTYNLVRPITYVQDNIDMAWLPLLGTPAFPEYTSGHSTQSGAVAATLTEMLGTVAFEDHTHDARGLAPRWFASLEAAADEAAISRLYGGIHYRAAIEIGLDQGRCIAGAIGDRVQFRGN